MTEKNGSTAQATYQKQSADENQHIAGSKHLVQPGAKDIPLAMDANMNFIDNSISPIIIMAAIEALADVGGMTKRDLNKRVESIKNLARAGVNAARSMANTIDWERQAERVVAGSQLHGHREMSQ